jgi:hypothetical protein
MSSAPLLKHVADQFALASADLDGLLDELHVLSEELDAGNDVGEELALVRRSALALRFHLRHGMHGLKENIEAEAHPGTDSEACMKGDA